MKGRSIAGSAGTQPFSVSIKDADSVGSRDCDASDAGGRASLTATLNPGTYRVGMTGKAGSTPTSGAFQLSFRDDAFSATGAAQRVGCSSANGYVDVPMFAGKEYFAVVKGAATAPVRQLHA